MSSLGPTPSEILDEHISDTALRGIGADVRMNKKEVARHLDKELQLLKILRLCLLCIYDSAEAGNVRCKETVQEIEKLWPR